MDFKYGNESVEERPASKKRGVTPKLCGYLKKYKIGTRGKSFKRRWFVLADNTCTLIYYRSAQDIVPLGEIDIASASFSFNMRNTTATGIDVGEPSQSTWIFEIT